MIDHFVRMLREYVSCLLVLSVFVVMFKADDVILKQDLPILFNHTKKLITSVCTEWFSLEPLDNCRNKFLSPVRNITSRPPVLSIKCESEKEVTFMTTPSDDRQLAVLVPNVRDADTNDLPYAIVEGFDPIGTILRQAKSDYTFWTTSLSADGSPSLWLQGPKLEQWETLPQKTYDIKTEMLTHEYKKGTQEIPVQITWNVTDESDLCFNVLNFCNKKILGDYYNKRIEPNENQSVVVNGVPLGDTCTFQLHGKYGTTNVTYPTPECYEIDGCIPLPEIFSNVSVDIMEAENGFGWTVLVSWSRPRVTPVYYNITLYADDVYNVVLPGNATEVLFENVSGEGFYNVTLMSATSRGKAYTSYDGFLPPLEAQSTTVGLLVGLVSLSALLFVAVIAVVVCCKQRRSEKMKFEYLQAMPHKLSKDTHLPLIRELTAKDRWEVEGSRLMLHEVVGEGAFGLVRRGTLAPGREVAVKMLKDFPSGEEVRSFHSEMELMKSVGAHPHVVSLLGCCSGRRPLIIAEYCSLGDLLTYLRCCWDVMLSKRNAKYYNNNKDEMEYRDNVNKDKDQLYTKAVANKLYDIQGVCDELTFADLLSYCRQIAMGMEFLASNRVVHRDLAARNVLVTGDKTLKIADFGLSRDVYQDNQYKQKGNGKMPVKWMALESLTHRIFTTQSDVWSFGVVMWEVVTVGGAPYPSVAASRLLRLLRAGYRMPCPRNCTPQLYEVMTWCWRTRPCERPTFAQLRARFDELLTAACADRYLTLELPGDLPSSPALPTLPSSPIPTATLHNDKKVWERAESYERPNAQRNHYTSPPVTQPS